MPTHGHVAKFVAADGRRDELIEILRPMFEEVKKEPGTLLYMMHVCPDDPGVVWFYERYADEAAFERHRTSATHDAVVARMMPLLDPRTEIRYLDLIDCKANAVLTAEVTGL